MRLVANANYWDSSRGPHLQEVIFRNDLTTEQALDLVCEAEGEVDIVTEVSPAQAQKVENSAHAKLVTIDAVRVIAGVINRDAEGLPFHDVRARLALNLAVNRDTIVKAAMFGHAQPLAGLTPPSAVTLLHRLAPYNRNPAKSAELWRESGAAGSRPIRIAAPSEFETIARMVAADLHAVLDVACDVILFTSADEKLELRRRLAEKKRPQDWDILIHEQGAQAADAPPLELHRAFVGETGEWRAGPIVPEFEALYHELVGETSASKMSRISYRIDKFVHEEALALFLCAPQALYAVNKHVDFTPYRTTFELAECKVESGHWSLR